MSDGLLPFKGLAWGAAAITIAVAVFPTASTFSFDALRTTWKFSTQSDPIRTFKRKSGTTTTTGGTTTDDDWYVHDYHHHYDADHHRCGLPRADDDSVELHHQQRAGSGQHSRVGCSGLRRRVPLHLQSGSGQSRRSDRLSRTAWRVAPPPVLRQHDRGRLFDLREPALRTAALPACRRSTARAIGCLPCSTAQVMWFGRTMSRSTTSAARRAIRSSPTRRTRNIRARRFRCRTG